MSEHEDVKEFMNKVTGLSGDLDFRKTLILEECLEIMNAETKEDLIDGLVDLVYVAHGTAIELGIDWEAHWKEVHRCNMQKIRGATKRGSVYDAVKPDGWKAPDHAMILARSKNATNSL